MLELTGVSKCYDGRMALQETDLTLERGKITVLIGPSGCGKSTVLRLLIGLISPDTGCVWFDGQPVENGNLNVIRQRMGYVIQDGGLFPHLTARGNATIMAHQLNWEEPRIEKRLDELRDLTRLPADALDRYPLQLSGGQRQRVSLMRALFLDPDVLLMDEPLGALDPLIRADLQQDLLDIFRKLKKTVVLVTHDMGEAGFLADTIIMMRAGRILQRGSLQDLIQEPEKEFVASFINAQRNPIDLSGATDA